MKKLLEAGAAIEKKDKVRGLKIPYFLFFLLSLSLSYMHMNTHIQQSNSSVCVSVGVYSGPLGLQRRQPAGPAAPS